MLRSALFLVALGACTAPASTPLADLRTVYGDTMVEVVARGPVNVELLVAPASECPVLGDDVVATFNGEPMHVARGGYDVTSRGCYPIAFWFDAVSSTVLGFDKQIAGSQLVVADASARWQIDTTRLFGQDFELDTAASRIVWHDVDQIASARVSPAVAIQIDGNAIAFPPGTPITWVDARAHPATTRCDGPAVCTVDLESAHDFMSAP